MHQTTLKTKKNSALNNAQGYVNRSSHNIIDYSKTYYIIYVSNVYIYARIYYAYILL